MAKSSNKKTPYFDLWVLDFSTPPPQKKKNGTSTIHIPCWYKTPTFGVILQHRQTYQPTVHPVAHLGTIHLHHATFKETTTTTQALQGACLGKQGEAEGRTVVDAGWHWWKMERWFLLGQDDF